MPKKKKWNLSLVVGGGIVLFFVLVALLAPLLAPCDPHAMGIPYLRPSGEHLLGTNDVGQDIFSELIYGTRVSMLIGFFTAFIVTILATGLALLAGYYGGWVDSLITRFTEFMMCLPIFFLILTINNMLPPNIFNVVAIIGAFSWMGSAKVIRGQVLYVKNMEYGRAAKALGLRDSAIIFKHILPNAMTPLIVSAAMGIANAIIMEAGLSYIGMGVQEPMPSWGSMLNASRSYMLESPHLALIPGTLICLVTLSLNFIGDGLRDAIDPKNAE